MPADVSQPKRQEWNYCLLKAALRMEFVSVLFNNKKCLHLGNFHHKTQNCYFKCNYGNPDVPQNIRVGRWQDRTIGRTSKSVEATDIKFVEDLSRWTSTRRLGRTKQVDPIS